jgi:hypothetical protein
MNHIEINPPKNDGWHNYKYSLYQNDQLNEKITFILNEACHVFYYHADGNWKEDKDYYANLLVALIKQHPSLPRKLLSLNDRVVKMITYRAIELINEQKKS